MQERYVAPALPRVADPAVFGDSAESSLCLLATQQHPALPARDESIVIAQSLQSLDSSHCFTSHVVFISKRRVFPIWLKRLSLMSSESSAQQQQHLWTHQHSSSGAVPVGRTRSVILVKLGCGQHLRKLWPSPERFRQPRD